MLLFILQNCLFFRCKTEKIETGNIKRRQQGSRVGGQFRKDGEKTKRDEIVKPFWLK